MFLTRAFVAIGGERTLELSEAIKQAANNALSVCRYLKSIRSSPPCRANATVFAHEGKGIFFVVGVLGAGSTSDEIQGPHIGGRRPGSVSRCMLGRRRECPQRIFATQRS